MRYVGLILNIAFILVALICFKAIVVNRYIACAYLLIALNRLNITFMEFENDKRPKKKYLAWEDNYETNRRN